MARLLTRLRDDQRGATAAEFGMVSVLFLAMVLGSIDFARLAWYLNSAKTATRMGARFLVVSPMISGKLAALDGTTSPYNKAPGETIPAGDVAAVTCTGAANGTFSCGAGDTPNATVATALVERMQRYYPGLTAANVKVTYTHVGIGYVGNPYAPDVEPMITVELVNPTFNSAVLQVFGLGSFNLPAMATTLSGEDLG